MPFEHGKNAFFELDTLDISAFTDSAELSRTLETAVVTAFGDCDNNYIPGLRDQTISISGSWDAAASGIDEKLDSIYDANIAVTWKYAPQGNAATNIQYAGSCIMTDAPVASPVGDKITWSASLQVTGGVTRSVIP